MSVGLLKLGKFIRIVPHPVMLGFVNGLAIVIFLAQLNNFKIGDASGNLQWMQGQAMWIMLGLVALTMAIIHFLPTLTSAVPSSLAAIVAASVQPDLMRPRELPQLRAIESPRHYIDLERLQDHELPRERWRYLRLLTRIATTGSGPWRPEGDVSQVGTLPYAIVEDTQRLAALFAQLRVRPDDPDLLSMAAQQAGFLAHYAQDLCQPLHTTVHHDGRARADGSSPHTGIHHQIDVLLESVSWEDKQASERPPQVLDPLFPGVLATLEESHSQVDRVYALVDASQQRGLAEFARQRWNRAVGFTVDLIRTAWVLSGTLELPGWAAGAGPPGASPR
jgi:hypothetical protein